MLVSYSHTAVLFFIPCVAKLSTLRLLSFLHFTKSDELRDCVSLTLFLLRTFTELLHNYPRLLPIVEYSTAFYPRVDNHRQFKLILFCSPQLTHLPPLPLLPCTVSYLIFFSLRKIQNFYDRKTHCVCRSSSFCIDSKSASAAQTFASLKITPDEWMPEIAFQKKRKRRESWKYKTKQDRKGGERRTFSNVDDARQLLDAIQQNVSLLDGGLVLVVLRVRSVGLDDAAHLVDATVQPASGDESCQLPESVFKNANIKSAVLKREFPSSNYFGDLCPAGRTCQYSLR